MIQENDGPVSPSEEKVHELVAEYHRLEDQGQAVSPADFVSQHPEHGEDLKSYFDGIQAVDQLSDPPPATEQTFVTGDTRAAADDQTIIEDSASIAANQRAATDAPPTKFGRYKILSELGRGAMGAVYLAQDEQLDRKVALEIPQFGGAMDSGLLERFYREARAAGNLRHPGICPVYDVGEIDGQHFITMAFIEGRPLRDFSKSPKRQADKQTARVIRKIAMAMAEAHDQNVIHRDLKPANIMIDTKNEPVVMDFGLARRAAENEQKLTHTGTVIGTPAYMSPEQVDGDNENVGPPADIYSLGVIFYELLTGELPFKGNLMSILRQISMKHPPAAGRTTQRSRSVSPGPLPEDAGEECQRPS
ncbi:MAG: serine/threonine-protein kinase [Planctomycetales bacterium]